MHDDSNTWKLQFTLPCALGVAERANVAEILRPAGDKVSARIFILCGWITIVHIGTSCE